MSTASAIFVFCLVLLLVMVTVGEWEAWPFSAYPMYSRRANPEQLSIFRIALVDVHGARSWWTPPFPVWAKQIDRRLRIACLGQDDLVAALLKSVECQEVLKTVSHQITLASPEDEASYSGLIVVRRCGLSREAGNGQFWQDEELIYHSLKEGTNEPLGNVPV